MLQKRKKFLERKKMKKLVLVWLFLFCLVPNSFSFIKVWEKQYSNNAYDLKFSQDGQKLFFYSNNYFNIINSSDGNLVSKIILPDSTRRSILSPDETMLLCRVKDSIIVIDLVNGARIKTFLSAFKYNNYRFYAISEDNDYFFEGGGSITNYDWISNSFKGYSRLILRSLINGNIVKTIIDSTDNFGIMTCFGYRKLDEYFFSSANFIDNDSLMVKNLFSFNSSGVSIYYSDTSINHITGPMLYGLNFFIKDFGEIITSANGFYDYDVITKNGRMLYIYTDRAYTDFERYVLNNQWYMLFIINNTIQLGQMISSSPPRFKTIEESDTGDFQVLATQPYYPNFASSKSDGTITMWLTSLSSVLDDNYLNLEKISLSPNPATDILEISYSSSIKNGLGGVSVEVFNVFSTKIPPRLTSSATPQEGNLRLDISCLPPGVYFVRIGEKVGKFVKI